MTRPTPGVLRETAVSAIIGALHNAHQAGPWALVEAVTGYEGHELTTRLTFACGPNYAVRDDPEDIRPRVVVRVMEE